MNKIFKIILFILIMVSPILFFKYFYHPERKPVTHKITKKKPVEKPKVALIFDDLGENTRDLQQIDSLDIPATISIVPGLKFSKNVAYMGSRYGFSVMIHLPLEPKNVKRYETPKYKFISSYLTNSENNALLRYYLNYIRLAVAVNNHMGSLATEDPKLMHLVLKAVKARGLVFVDSRTSSRSIACKVAREEGVLCAENEGFFDSGETFTAMEKKFYELIAKTEKKGKIIMIAHPKKTTFLVLKKVLPEAKKQVDFITITKYFGL